MAFLDFLNEAKGNKRLGAKNFEAIIIGVFGPAIKDEIDVTGKSGNQLIVDLSKVKALVNSIGIAKLTALVIEEAKEAGIELVPTDGTDSKGIVPDNDDMAALKLKGNDYANNKDHEDTGEFNSDLFISLDTLTITS